MRCTRRCDVWRREFLQPFGIEVSYFAANGHDLEAQLQANTKMIYTEVPGSLLYELCDLPAIVALCKKRGILVAVDNTWGSGYLYRPLALGRRHLDHGADQVPERP